MKTSLISVNPKICGGAPCIAGTRIMVSNILGQLAAGRTFTEIRESYPQLIEEQIRAAVEYALALVQDEEVEVVSQ